MTELILHMNNYSITEAITAYQMYHKCAYAYTRMCTCTQAMHTHARACVHMHGHAYTVKVPKTM